MERLFFKKHRQLILYFKLYLRKLFPFVEAFFGVVGFFLDLRGKVSVTGNAKKRHVCLKFGQYTASTAKYKADITKGTV